MAKQKMGKLYVARCITDDGAVTFKPKDKVIHTSKGYVGTVKRTDDDGGIEILWHGSKRAEYPPKVRQEEVRKVKQTLVMEITDGGLEKIAGFISSKAQWVKDGDKFLPEEVLKVAEIKYGTLVYAKSDETQEPYLWSIHDVAERNPADYEFLHPHEAYYKFKVKCGNCEVYH